MLAGERGAIIRMEMAPGARFKDKEFAQPRLGIGMGYQGEAGPLAYRAIATYLFAGGNDDVRDPMNSTEGVWLNPSVSYAIDVHRKFLATLGVSIHARGEGDGYYPAFLQLGMTIAF